MSLSEIDPLFLPYLRERPRLSYTDPEDPWLTRNIVFLVEACFGRKKLERIYQSLKSDSFSIQSFFTQALEAANISVQYDPQRLQAVPRQGPLVFVANHPFGLVDGMILCDLALKARGDLRIMLHSLLCQDREFAPYFLPIDFGRSRQALRTNIRSKQLAAENLQEDTPVLIFPSGMVATAGRGGFGSVRDKYWSTFAAKIIRDARATVVPVFFHGRNSRKFHVVSRFSQALRSALLLHEAINKFGRHIKVEIGEPLVWEQLESVGGRQQLTDYLYDQVLRLPAA